MASPSVLQGDHHFAGNVTFAGSVTIPATQLGDSMWRTGTAYQLTSEKQEHRHWLHYSEVAGTAATSLTKRIHTVHGATCAVVAFKAGSKAIAIGNATLTVDLQKNGVSVLTGVVNLTSANTANLPASATILTAGGVADDRYEIVTVATIGTGTLPTGLFVLALIDEDPQ